MKQQTEFVFTSSKEVYGSSWGASSIPRLVQHLGTNNALLALAESVWLLEKYTEVNRDVQMSIAKQVLPRSKWFNVHELVFERDRTVFFRNQFFILMKYVARYSQRKQINVNSFVSDLNNLGPALLAVSDLVNSESSATWTENGEKLDIYSAAVGSLATSYYQSRWLPFLPLIRYRHMYLSFHRKRSAKQPASYIDIESAFKQAVGVPLEAYFDIGFCLVYYYFKLFLVDAPPSDQSLIFDRGTQFRNAIVDFAWIEQTLQELTMSLEDLKQHAQSASTREIAYDFLLFKNRPLISVEEGLLLSSLLNLVEKLSAGVYWILSNYFTTIDGPKKSEQWATYNGDLFQDYVTELARAIHQRETSPNKRMLEDKIYSVGKRQERTPDVVLIGTDYAILIEATAARLTARRSIALGEKESIEKDFEKAIFKKARQTDRFINKVKKWRGDYTRRRYFTNKDVLSSSSTDRRISAQPSN